MAEIQRKSLNNRHLAIMDMLIAMPHLTHNEVADAVGMTASTVSVIVRSDLFQLAFAEYRREHQKSVSELAIEATREAIEFERGMIRGVIPGPNGEEIFVNDVQLKQASAKDILSLGHAKAVERSVSLNGTLEEALAIINQQKKVAS